MSLSLSATEPLKNKRIVLGITGSIAGCKADRIIRELQWKGADVQVMFTAAGEDYFTPQAAAALTGNPVLTADYQEKNREKIVHIETIEQADCILVAPATANRLLQLAWPVANDLFSTIIYAFDGPVYYAPAMNEKMWNNPRLQEVVEQFSESIIFPDSGEMACGTYGPGRLPEPASIVEQLIARLWPSPLEGQSWLINGGGTKESWDDIRYLTNRSTGLMGESLARFAGFLGAEVVYLTAQDKLFYPADGRQTVFLDSAAEMLDKARSIMPGMTGFMGAAAVADYRPVRQSGKFSSKSPTHQLRLEKNPDIISTLKQEFDDRKFIGFAAQEKMAIDQAVSKLQAKNLDAIALNAISEGCFAGTENHLILLTASEGQIDLGRRSKLELALQIWLNLLTEKVI